MSKYIDSVGVTYLWTKAKALFATKAVATGSTDGLMSSSDKNKVDGLATVASTGAYSDLSGKPTIPSAVTETTVSGWGFTKNAGTVTKVNNVSPVNGNVTISIPTVTDTYSATSSSGMSGKAVASAISDALVGSSKFIGSTTSFTGSKANFEAALGTTHYKKGEYWLVDAAYITAHGSTIVGVVCEAGDMIYAVSDYSSSYKASDFTVVQNNIETMSAADIDAAIAAAS